MTARKCFTNKVVGGKVSGRAGQEILELLDRFERHHKKRIGAGFAQARAATDAAAVRELVACIGAQPIQEAAE